MASHSLIYLACSLFLFLYPENVLGQCGTRPGYMQKRIVGGNTVSESTTKWPWSGALLVDNNHFCSVTLISDQYVITAAQCIQYVNEPNRYSVKFDQGTSNEQVFDVMSFYLHPLYNANSRENDGMILKLTTPVIITDELRPACFPAPETDYSIYTDCHLTGFGVSHTIYNLLPPTMQELEFSLFPLAECNAFFEPLVNDMIVAESQTCAGHGDLSAQKGPCVGDTGAPLSCDQGDNTWAVVALASMTVGCQYPGFPVIFAKTSNMYTDFIENSINGIEPTTRNFECVYDYEFKCKTGYCIPHTYRCDDYIDCPGGDDEEYCGHHVRFFDPTAYDKAFDGIAEEFNTGTVDECAEKCLSSLEYLCNQFDYNEQSGTCRLRTEAFEQISLTSTADTVFFQIDKFPGCGAALETNFFDLPRFSAPRYFINESTVRSCRTTVSTHPGTRVQITFDFVLIHPDSPCSCKADFYFHEGGSTTYYCIDDLPNTFTAEGNELVVEWASQRPELSGFIATFKGL